MPVQGNGVYTLTYTNSTFVPVCSFTVTPTSGASPLTVQFNDTSTNNPTSWSWTFGDGGTSTDQNATHTYTAAGTYDVNHSATNSGGTGWLNRTDYITVSDPAAILPIVKFTTNVSSGYAPLAVKFTDQSTGRSLNRWNWSFGDGTWFNTTVTSQRSPAHVYPTPGSYTAVLTVCNASGCNTTVPGKTITVNLLIPPVVKFATNVSSGFAPLAVKFTDQSTGSPTRWNWNFGDGSWFNTTNSSQKSPSYVYVTPANYTANLIACNAAGCNMTSQGKVITVKFRALPIASFTTNVTNGNAPLAVKFTDRSTGKSLNRWNWSFGDGTWFNTTIAAQKNPAHVYTAQGSYTSRLMVSNSSGSNTTAQGTVIVVTAPVQTTYKVYAEAGDSGTGIYDMAKGFWDVMSVARSGGISWEDWQGGSDIIKNYSAREGHWRRTDANPPGHANQWVENADFAYFSGHGNPNKFYFEVPDENSGMVEATAQNISLGSGRLKWAVIDSCLSLNEGSWTNWNPSFNGLRMLLGVAY